MFNVWILKNGKIFTSKFVGTGPLSYEKINLSGRGLTKVEKHWSRGTMVCSRRASPKGKLCLGTPAQPAGWLSYLTYKSRVTSQHEAYVKNTFQIMLLWSGSWRRVVWCRFLDMQGSTASNFRLHLNTFSSNPVKFVSLVLVWCYNKMSLIIVELWIKAYQIFFVFEQLRQL